VEAFPHPTPAIRRVDTVERALDAYAPFVGHDVLDDLRRLAEPLQGLRWASLNSTADGGGVAEMLRSLVPLMRGLGLAAEWCVMGGDDAFFAVTKKFHNLLQGVAQPISLEEIFGVYLETAWANAAAGTLESDVIVVHDPQPLALAGTGALAGRLLWRCHIDTSAPDPGLWRFLLPYVNRCDGAIFTMAEFVGQGVQVPTYEISPCIDPLAEKNRVTTRREAIDVLAPLLGRDGIDPDRPIIAAISRYDVHKNQGVILEAFRRMRAAGPAGPPPQLVFLGNTASDDPEGAGVLTSLRARCGDDSDVTFWVDVEDNDRVVGALCRLARAFVHVSTREGFGLVVSEALWQGTPVIGSRVGGIVKQVIDGQTGFLVDPDDVDAIAAHMMRLLDEPELAAALGAQGRKHVRRWFLLPELARRHLTLARLLAGIDRSQPDFRLDAAALRPAGPRG